MTNPDFEHIKPVVSVARHRNVAVLSVDNPPINALSDTVRAGLCSALREAEADPQCGRWCWRARATRSSPARISGSLRVRRALPRQSMCPP